MLKYGIIIVYQTRNTGNLNSALGVFTLGLATMGATNAYKAIKDHLISKKYSKERQGLAAKYQAYLDSIESPDLSK